jgi:hypothetical protein
LEFRKNRWLSNDIGEEVFSCACYDNEEDPRSEYYTHTKLLNIPRKAKESDIPQKRFKRTYLTLDLMRHGLEMVPVVYLPVLILNI